MHFQCFWPDLAALKLNAELALTWHLAALTLSFQ